MGYKEKWMANLDLDKNGLSKMVEDNIQRYRTSTARINVRDKAGKPVEGANIKAEQIKHEFKFGCNAFMADDFETPEKNQEYERIFRIVWWNLVDGYAFVNPENPSWNEDYYGGGLLRKDFTPKPAFEVVNRLINKEWKTNVTDITDEKGNMSFRGFHGEYKITVEKNGFVSEHTVKLSKTSPFIHIQLK